MNIYQLVNFIVWDKAIPMYRLKSGEEFISTASHYILFDERSCKYIYKYNPLIDIGKYWVLRTSDYETKSAV